MPGIGNADGGVAGQRDPGIHHADQIDFSSGDAGEPHSQPSAALGFDADHIFVCDWALEIRIETAEGRVTASARADPIDDRSGGQRCGEKSRDDRGLRIRISKREQIEIETVRRSPVPTNKGRVSKLPPDGRPGSKVRQATPLAAPSARPVVD